MTNIRIFIVIMTAFCLFLGSSVYAETTSYGTEYSTTGIDISSQSDYFEDSKVLYVGESIQISFSFQVTSLGTGVTEVNSAKARVEWSADVFNQPPTTCETTTGMTITTAGAVNIACVLTLNSITSQTLAIFSYGIYFKEKKTGFADQETNESVYSQTIDLRPATVPHSPQNLQYDEGDEQVTLTWDKPVSDGGSDITGYNVYRDADSTSIGNTMDLTGLTYTDTGLTNGQEYNYSIKAVNDKGDSPYSNSVSVTPTGFPSAPENLQATAGDGQVTLNWDAPNDGGSAITGYKIQVESEGSTRVAFTPNSPFTDTGLTNGQAYTYSIKAVNANGDGVFSSSETRTPTGNAFAPQNLILKYTGGDTEVTLEWEVPSDNGGSLITGYNVYRADGSQPPQSITNNRPGLTYIDSGLAYEESYTYSIKAVNDKGDSPYSNSVSVTPTGFPSAPENLQATAGDGQVTLNWDAPNDGGSAITGYKIQVVSEGSTRVAFTPNSPFTDTGLTNGQAYTYSIKAVNANGDGVFSSSETRTPTGLPKAPQNLQAISSNGNVTLNWDEPSDNGGTTITLYNIYRGSSGSGPIANTTGLEYNDTGLTNGEEYTYYIEAVNDNGESFASYTVKATPTGLPSAPVNLQASSMNGRVDLNWSTPSSDGGSSITGYMIFRNNVNLTSIIGFISVSTYNDSGVINGESYTYCIKAINSNGDSPCSSSASAIPATNSSAPENLQATGGDEQLILTWDAPSDNGGSVIITGYMIFRNDVYLTTIGGLMYTNGGLVNGQSYTYHIIAVNTAGDSEPSEPVSITIGDIPSAPENLQATSGDEQLTLSWSTPSSDGGSSIHGYKIYRNNVHIGTTSFLTFSDTGLTNGQSYLYCVSAINNNGDSPCSSPIDAIPSAPETSPTDTSSSSANFQFLPAVVILLFIISLRVLSNSKKRKNN